MIRISLILTLLLILMQSCAPVFSELQSARTVGKNRVDVTPSFSTVGFTDEGDSDGVQNHIGIQGAYGLHDRVDIRLRYEYIWLKDNDGEGGYHVLGLGPKVGLYRDYIAFAMPIGTAIGDDVEDAWQLHPTALFTWPVYRDVLDVNLASKYLITFCDGCDDLIAINLGLAVSRDLGLWAIRPEFGILLNPGESGFYSHFSVGISKTFGKKDE